MSSGQSSAGGGERFQRIAKATAALLFKCPVKLSVQAKRFQTKQRRKTFARPGEETGLKALSQPSGTRARDCDCRGATGGRNSCCQTVGFAVGSRSPFSAWFTELAGVEVNPAPVVEYDGKDTRLAAPNENATAATRTDHMLRIGSSPNSRQTPDQIPHVPIGEALGPAYQTWRARRGSATHRNSLCCDTAHTCVMTRARCRNKQQRRALSCGPAILPPPRLAGHIGRS